MRRSKGTEIESSYLLPLGKTSWPSKTGITKEDKATTMDIEMHATTTTTRASFPSSSIMPKEHQPDLLVQRYVRLGY